MVFDIASLVFFQVFAFFSLLLLLGLGEAILIVSVLTGAIVSVCIVQFSDRLLEGEGA